MFGRSGQMFPRRAYHDAIYEVEYSSDSEDECCRCRGISGVLCWFFSVILLIGLAASIIITVFFVLKSRNLIGGSNGGGLFDDLDLLYGYNRNKFNESSTTENILNFDIGSFESNEIGSKSKSMDPTRRIYPTTPNPSSILIPSSTSRTTKDKPIWPKDQSERENNGGEEDTSAETGLVMDSTTRRGDSTSSEENFSSTAHTHVLFSMPPSTNTNPPNRRRTNKQPPLTSFSTSTEKEYTAIDTSKVPSRQDLLERIIKNLAPKFKNKTEIISSNERFVPLNPNIRVKTMVRTRTTTTTPPNTEYMEPIREIQPPDFSGMKIMNDSAEFMDILVGGDQKRLVTKETDSGIITSAILPPWFENDAEGNNNGGNSSESNNQSHGINSKSQIIHQIVSPPPEPQETTQKPPNFIQRIRPGLSEMFMKFLNGNSNQPNRVGPLDNTKTEQPIRTDDPVMITNEAKVREPINEMIPNEYERPNRNEMRHQSPPRKETVISQHSIKSEMDTQTQESATPFRDLLKELSPVFPNSHQNPTYNLSPNYEIDEPQESDEIDGSPSHIIEVAYDPKQRPEIIIEDDFLNSGDHREPLSSAGSETQPQILPPPKISNMNSSLYENKSTTTTHIPELTSFNFGSETNTDEGYNEIHQNESNHKPQNSYVNDHAHEIKTDDNGRPSTSHVQDIHEQEFVYSDDNKQEQQFHQSEVSETDQENSEENYQDNDQDLENNPMSIKDILEDVNKKNQADFEISKFSTNQNQGQENFNEGNLYLTPEKTSYPPKAEEVEFHQSPFKIQHHPQQFSNQEQHQEHELNNQQQSSTTQIPNIIRRQPIKELDDTLYSQSHPSGEFQRITSKKPVHEVFALKYTPTPSPQIQHDFLPNSGLSSQSEYAKNVSKFTPPEPIDFHSNTYNFRPSISSGGFVPSGADSWRPLVYNSDNESKYQVPPSSNGNSFPSFSDAMKLRPTSTAGSTTTTGLFGFDQSKEWSGFKSTKTNPPLINPSPLIQSPPSSNVPTRLRFPDTTQNNNNNNNNNNNFVIDRTKYMHRPAPPPILMRRNPQQIRTNRRKLSFRGPPYLSPQQQIQQQRLLKERLYQQQMTRLKEGGGIQWPNEQSIRRNG